MKTAEVCEVLKSAGLAGVSSVLATGNVIFQSDIPQHVLRRFLEQTLSEYYKDNVNLFVKNADEVSALLSSAPFQDNLDFHIYTFICEPSFEDVLLNEFNSISPSDGEAASINNGLFYWRCRKGATLDSGFSKILGRKNMRDKFTSRNIATMAKVAAKMK